MGFYTIEKYDDYGLLDTTYLVKVHTREVFWVMGLEIVFTRRGFIAYVSLVNSSIYKKRLENELLKIKQ